MLLFFNPVKRDWKTLLDKKMLVINFLMFSSQLFVLCHTPSIGHFLLLPAVAISFFKSKDFFVLKI